MVSGHGRRFYLDGAVVPAMVRCDRQASREISHLQRRQPPSAHAAITMNLQIDQQRLQTEIDELAQITEAELPVVTRVVFSVADLRARAWFAAKCKEAGLELRVDAVGNTFA